MPGIDRQELAAEYGWSLAFLNANPELKQLFNRAVNQTWTPERFVAELRGTNWFQDHSATYRQYLVDKIVDPASWQADYDKTHAMISDMYGSLWGNTSRPGLENIWTRRAMMFGWSEAQIKDHMVQTVASQKMLFNSPGLGGQAAQVKDQVQQLAEAYGVTPSNKWMTQNIQNVLLGNTTIDGTVDTMRNWAMNKYAAFADQIKGGKTVADIADPYVQSMGQLLELDPSQINLQDRFIQQALTRTVQGKGGQSQQVPMSLTDFGDLVRNDPRWMKTNQARDQFQSIASGLLQAWGLM